MFESDKKRNLQPKSTTKSTDIWSFICKILWLEENELSDFSVFSNNCIDIIEKTEEWIVINTNMRFTEWSYSFLHWADVLTPIKKWLEYSLLKKWDSINRIKNMRFNKKMESQLDIICSYKPIMHNTISCFEAELVTDLWETIYIKWNENGSFINPEQIEKHPANNAIDIEFVTETRAIIRMLENVDNDHIENWFLDIINKILLNRTIFEKLVNEIWLENKIDSYREEWVKRITKLIWWYDDIVFPSSFENLDWSTVRVNKTSTKEIRSWFLSQYEIEFTNAKNWEKYWWKTTLIIHKEF
jgi:hypothetical protein